MADKSKKIKKSKTESLAKLSTGLSNPEGWVAKHGDALFGYAFKFISDRTVAEDLVQETLLAALKGKGNFSGSSTERTWLIGILKNKIVDQYRKSSRETTLPQIDHLSTSDDSDYIQSGQEAGSWQPNRRPADWAVDLNDPAEQAQFWDRLHHCLDGLDDRLARGYALREIYEIEYQEVCNVLAVSPTNLRVMLHRARKHLRRCLEINWVGK